MNLDMYANFKHFMYFSLHGIAVDELSPYARQVKNTQQLIMKWKIYIYSLKLGVWGYIFYICF